MNTFALAASAPPAPAEGKANHDEGGLPRAVWTAGCARAPRYRMPVIEDDQVLIRVHAASVNPVEWYGVTGPYFARIGNGLRRPKSAAVGGDVAGRIEAVGRDVKASSPVTRCSEPPQAPGPSTRPRARFASR